MPEAVLERKKYSYIPDPDRGPRVRPPPGWDHWFKANPWGLSLLYFPLAALLLRWSAPIGLPASLFGFGVGLMGWTLLEYIIHRGPLHVDPDAWWTFGTARQHWVHHQHPEDVAEVALSPKQTLPLALVLLGLMRLLLPWPSACALTAGMYVGYVGYETTHWMWHAPIRLPKWAWLQALRKNHAIHHYDAPDSRFGVSVTLWDHVFGTR